MTPIVVKIEGQNSFSEHIHMANLSMNEVSYTRHLLNSYKNIPKQEKRSIGLL